jgi:hypothetical protein
MTATGRDPLLLIDPDVDALAWEFLNSQYANDVYAIWPLERRLDGFLRRLGLARVADDGDMYDIILDRVMAYMSVLPRRADREGQ